MGPPSAGPSSSRVAATTNPGLNRSPSSRLSFNLIERRSAINESDQIFRAIEITLALKKRMRGSNLHDDDKKSKFNVPNSTINLIEENYITNVLSQGVN